jgi:hypothetical protein
MWIVLWRIIITDKYTERGWILDTRCWMLDTRCWILDTRYWILEVGYWILVIGILGYCDIDIADSLPGFGELGQEYVLYCRCLFLFGHHTIINIKRR